MTSMVNIEGNIVYTEIIFLVIARKFDWGLATLSRINARTICKLIGLSSSRYVYRVLPTYSYKG